MSAVLGDVAACLGVGWPWVLVMIVNAAKNAASKKALGIANAVRD